MVRKTDTSSFLKTFSQMCIQNQHRFLFFYSSDYFLFLMRSTVNRKLKGNVKRLSFSTILHPSGARLENHACTYFEKLNHWWATQYLASSLTFCVQEN